MVIATSSFELRPGTRPLLLSMPHCGTELPAGLESRLSSVGRSLIDTDWHVDRLYDFAAALGASLLKPRYSRYLVDLNRPPDDSSLYPGAQGTGLCPLTSFNGDALYQPGCAPDAAEIALRVDQYWRPYHQALQSELKRLKQDHPAVILFEAHSIRSVVPRLFDGRLPDLNLGTNDGASCAPGLSELATGHISRSSYGHVIDGRFKGGYITRAYGQPGAAVHALQLEIAQLNYMDESAPFAYRPERAENLRRVLSGLLESLLEWAESR